MHITFAYILIGSIFSIVARAAEVERVTQAAADMHAQGIPVSVSVIQAAQVVVLDQDQILSIAADIAAQEKAAAGNELGDNNNGVEDEGEAIIKGKVAANNDEIAAKTVLAESIQQHANHLTTSWSVSGTVSYPLIIDTEFTFSPITLAPESSRSGKAPAPTQKPTTQLSAIKKVKSSATSSSPTLLMYWASTVAIFFCFMIQYHF